MDEIILSKLEANVYRAIAPEAKDVGNGESRWLGNLLGAALKVIPDPKVAKKCLHSFIFVKRIIRPLVECSIAGKFIDDIGGDGRDGQERLFRIYIADYPVRGEVKPMTIHRQFRRKPDFDPDKRYRDDPAQKADILEKIRLLAAESGGAIEGLYSKLEAMGVKTTAIRATTHYLTKEGLLERKNKKWLVIEPKTAAPKDEMEITLTVLRNKAAEKVARIDELDRDKTETERQRIEAIGEFDRKISDTLAEREAVCESIKAIRKIMEELMV